MPVFHAAFYNERLTPARPYGVLQGVCDADALHPIRSSAGPATATDYHGQDNSESEVRLLLQLPAQTPIGAQ